jgi:uncharacterized membrane protein YhaH (DUF805 family)
MGFGEAISICFSKFLTFEGRAHRPEYWWWGLFVWLASIVISIIVAVGGYILGTAISVIVAILLLIALIVPSISVAVRRLHDVDRGGGWWFIQFVPFVGPCWFLYFMVQPGTARDPTPGPNRFGDGLR